MSLTTADLAAQLVTACDARRNDKIGLTQFLKVFLETWDPTMRGLTDESWTQLTEAYLTKTTEAQKNTFFRIFLDKFAEPAAAASTGGPLGSEAVVIQPNLGAAASRGVPSAGELLESVGLGKPTTSPEAEAAAAATATPSPSTADGMPLPDFPAVPNPGSIIRNTITKVEKTINILKAFKELFIIEQNPIARGIHISTIDRYLNTSAGMPGITQSLAKLKELPLTVDSEAPASVIFDQAVYAIKDTYNAFKTIYLGYTDNDKKERDKTLKNAAMGINVSEPLDIHVEGRDKVLAPFKDKYATELLQHLASVEINYLDQDEPDEDDEDIENWIRTELLNPNASWMIGLKPVSLASGFAAGSGGAGAGAGGQVERAQGAGAGTGAPITGAAARRQEVLRAAAPVLQGQALIARRAELEKNILVLNKIILTNRNPQIVERATTRRQTLLQEKAALSAAPAAQAAAPVTQPPSKGFLGKIRGLFTRKGGMRKGLRKRRITNRNVRR